MFESVISADNKSDGEGPHLTSVSLAAGVCIDEKIMMTFDFFRIKLNDKSMVFTNSIVSLDGIVTVMNEWAKCR